MLGVMYHGAEKADNTFKRPVQKARDLGARFKNRRTYSQEYLRSHNAVS